MEQRVLGRSGIEVSRLCFGALTVGPLQANMSIDDGAEVIARALDQGVNFIDTAQLYKSYAHIRCACERLPNKDVVISSKAYAVTYEDALEAVEQARRELNRDVIDIFMLHEQESEHTFRGHQDALDCLYDLKAKGVIRAVGASMHMVAAVKAATKIGLDIIHPLINVRGVRIADGSRDDMTAAIKEAHDADIGVFGMKPLGGGLLLDDVEGAFEFVLGADYLDSIAVGMRDIAEVDANVARFEGREIADDIGGKLRKIPRKLFINQRCDGCGECVLICGQGALAVEGKRARVAEDRCIMCGYCAARCKNFAIRIR